MSYLLIPHGVSSTSATLWVGGINDSLDHVQLTLIPGDTCQPFKAGAGFFARGSNHSARRLYFTPTGGCHQRLKAV